MNLHAPQATQTRNAGQANLGVDTVMDREHRRTEVQEPLIPPVGPVATSDWAIQCEFEHVMGYLAALLFG
jgi:hypothetical protein